MSAGTTPASQTVAVALILLGIGATFTSMNIALDQYGRWGARIFPLAGSLSLVALGLAEWFGARGKPVPAPNTTHLPAIAALLALSIAYVWVMAQFGYLISTAVAAPLALWIFGVRNIIGLCAAAVLCPAVYHLVFFELLGVFPPLGQWFDLVDVFGGY